MTDIFLITFFCSLLVQLIAIIHFFNKRYKKQHIPFYWILIILFGILGALIYFGARPWNNIKKREFLAGRTRNV